jgi:hypothetical protein
MKSIYIDSVSMSLAEQYSYWIKEEFICMYKFIDQLGIGVEEVL